MNPEQQDFVPDIKSAPEYGEQAKDYPTHLKQFYDTLVGDMRFVPQEVRCGPVYHIKTSKGMEVRVLTYHRDRQNPRYTRGDYKKCRHTFLIATDVSGEILGSRMMDIYYFVKDERQHAIEAAGQIATRYRGQGFSTAIDLVNREILQNEVNRTGGTLRWGIINGNAKSLLDLKKPKLPVPGLVVPQKSEAETELDIRAKEEEQDRWQAIYGGLGKFGAMGSINADEDDFEIYLRKDQPAQDLDRVDEVWLERDLDEHFIEVRTKGLSLVAEGQEQGRQQEKTLELKNLMGQMEAVLSGK